MEERKKQISVNWVKSGKVAAGLFLGYLFWFFLLVLALLWFDPPFTSFTLQEDWEQHGAERYNLREYWIDNSEIPTSMKWAVIASEDQRFWNHNGLDFKAIEKAIEENENSQQTRGASTISQQVTKNLFLWPGKSYFRKGLEAAITILIDAVWPKERILEVYLNIVEFGPGIYGIGRASEHFFGKPADRLTADESARMATVLPNPKRMRVEPPSPFVAERKTWVLRNMTQLSGISYYQPEPTLRDSVFGNQDSLFKVSYDSLRSDSIILRKDSALYIDTLSID